MRIFLKSLLKITEKFNSYVFYFLWWNGLRISKIIVEKFWKKKTILMYLIILWWNNVKISKIFAANFETIFHNDFSNAHSIPSQNIVEFKTTPFCKICNNDFWNPHSISSQSEEYLQLNYFVMKSCENFKNHCWKLWRSFILMYSIILWWNDVRISKIIVEQFGKTSILCIFSFCDEIL